MVEETEKKEYTVIVDGQKKVVHEDVLTFEEVIALAFDPVPSGPNVSFTVSYRDAADGKSGTLTKGESVKIKDGTIFNVTHTDKS